jgi:hypothetical protein
MSYCRWSTDDYRCDLYVYESDDGFHTHVAGRRHVLAVELPPPVDITKNVDGYVARHRALMDALENATLEPIGGPHDGESFIDSTAKECAERVEALRAAGYRCPDDVVAVLLSEHTGEP